MARRGSGDGHVSVLWAAANAPINRKVEQAAKDGRSLVLDPDHPLAKAAFKNQSGAPTPPAG